MDVDLQNATWPEIDRIAPLAAPQQLLKASFLNDANQPCVSQKHRMIASALHLSSSPVRGIP